MTDPGVTRVAVYIDFDNIVISRYDQIHGRSQFQRDKVRGFDRTERSADPGITERLRTATVDVGAIIDFASSFGTLVLTRAYADWSVLVNADYRGQLVSRAVDLVQLFPAAAYAKNGADIRLAVDAVEDMFRLPDLTHVVIVAGDSDYIALAQRCKRLGRYVVGVGVAGSTSRSLAAACDELVTYDALPGVTPIVAVAPPAARASSPRTEPEEAADPAPAQPSSRRTRRTATATASNEAAANEATANEAAAASESQSGGEPPSSNDTRSVNDDALEPEDQQSAATSLLERALRLGHEKDDADWLHSSAVKIQMKRMDPSFSEKTLGYRSFSDFVKSRDTVAELDETDPVRLVRLISNAVTL